MCRNLNDTALLIQGPVNPCILETLNYNQVVFSEIILSTWEPMNNRERVLLLKIKENFQLKITVSNPPNNQFNHLAKSLVNQFVGVSNGLKLMQSQNFVKVRTDEVYALSKYVDAICCSQTIFQSSNFIVKGFSYHKFCISDHLFSAPKDKMLEAIDWVLSATYEELGAQLGKDIKVPESILGYSLLYVTLRNQ